TSQAEAVETLKLYNKNVHGLVTDVDRTVHLLQSLSEKKLSWFKTAEFIFLGLFLGIIGTSFFLAVFFIRRPLLGILKGAEAFSRGALNYRIPVRSRDEIGALAQGFNTMAETIENDIKEMQQLHSQRMSTVGHLSNGVAHHINNPLSGIDMSADILLKKIEGTKEHIHPEELRNHLRRIKEAGRRCETVVRDLLSISRISNPEKSPKVLNRLVELALNKTANQLETSSVQLIKELSPTAPLVLCNHAQLEVAFVNLISNAIDVLPNGGTLTVKTRHLTSEDKVEVTISDTGPTIDKKDLPHLFDPYFILRIRPSTRCTGLELALAQLAILSHGGTIEVDSEEGRGTTFKVNLPVHREAGELPTEKDAGKGRLVRTPGYHVVRASCWKRGRRRGRSFRALP
ncbi:MAG: ATP-binding protein, partial [Candidatus Brocadiaceae bacterium]|nr:ATP-binding protein [Candidatus Brocadiaceae bacterium]